MNDISSEIRDVNLVEVVAGAGVVLKNGGSGRLVGLCPLHGEKTPSFTVYTGKNSFYCFGCGAGGDAAEFLMKLHGIEFPEALRRLGVDNNGNRPVKAPLRVPRVKSGNPGDVPTVPAVYGRPADLWVEKATKFSAWCHGQLMKNEKQLAWLAARGIGRQAVVDSGLGWNPGESDDKPQFFRHRHSWGLPDELKPSGKKKMLWLPRGLVIPMFDGDNVLRLRIRADRPRYYVVPGSSMSLMVINGDHRCLTIVESELDAIMLSAVAGDLSGYVALGSSHAKPDGSVDYYLKRAGNIVLALDYDDAGIKAMDWWAENYPRAKVWPLPDGKDPGDAFMAGVDLREWVLASYPDGWHLQRSWRKRPKKTKKQTDIEMVAAMPPPDPVKELADLMRETPVAIVTRRDQLKIVSPNEWNYQNWEKFGRISQLVYFTDVVFDYLSGLSRDKITWRDLCAEITA